MSADTDELSKVYAKGLAEYLRDRSEAALSDVYVLGRQAMASGLGVLDMAGLHRSAIATIVKSQPSTDLARVADAAADYFNELLSPFEMSFRGYKVANDELQILNRSLQEQKDAVELANRELESFSHSVSHDLRGPLGRIDGFSELVLERQRDKLDEEGKRYLDYIRSSTKDMLQLVNDLLNLSRVSRTEMVREKVDISALVRTISRRLHDFAPERQASIIIQDDMYADADASLLAIVFDNLLGNAWKFTSKQPRASIAVGCERRADATVFYVRDNGAGFDMTYVSKLFGAFSRLHSSSEFEGTGVGLATVQRVIHRHGGAIWAEGAVGAGATFYFTLDAGRPS